MIIFVFILVIVIIKDSLLSKENELNKNYLGKEQCKNINGIFVIMVLLSHYYQYINPSSLWHDAFYTILRDHLNQSVVMTFLFFSGFGMMESLKKQGYSYIISMLSKFIRLLIKFDIAVLLFLLLDICLGLHYSSKQIIMSFLCWESIGNSNWYIFVTLSVYLLIFIAFTITKPIRNERLWHYIGIVVFTVLTMGLVLFLIKMGKEWFWYDTVILVPVGFCYSLFKEKIDTLINRKKQVYSIFAVLVIGAYILSYFRRFDYGIEGYTIWALSFIGLVLIISMKLTIRSKLLEWAGSHIFSIYILQRLSMIVLFNMGFIENHKYMSLIVAIVVTAFIAPVFEKSTDFILGLIKRIKITTKKCID